MQCKNGFYKVQCRCIFCGAVYFGIVWIEHGIVEESDENDLLCIDCHQDQLEIDILKRSYDGI